MKSFLRYWVRRFFAQLLGPRLYGHVSHLRQRNRGFSELHLIHRWYCSRGLRDGFLVDVGVHHGWSSQPFLVLGWTGIGFEPDSANFAEAVGNLPSARFSLLPNAVGESPIERAAIYSSPESNGISTLTPFRESHEKSGNVKVVTLGQSLAECGYPNVNLLKIDAEGWDLFVLRGFPWNKTPPEIILTEFEDRKTIPLGYDWNDLAQFLQTRGYIVYVSEWAPIVAYGANHRWRFLWRYPGRLSAEGVWGNLIGVRGDVHNEWETFTRQLVHQTHSNE